MDFQAGTSCEWSMKSHSFFSFLSAPKQGPLKSSILTKKLYFRYGQAQNISSLKNHLDVKLCIHHIELPRLDANSTLFFLRLLQPLWDLPVWEKQGDSKKGSMFLFFFLMHTHLSSITLLLL